MVPLGDFFCKRCREWPGVELTEDPWSSSRMYRPTAVDVEIATEICWSVRAD